MGYELLVSNPATSGSHSWKCLLASNTNDKAMTRLAYCGRREMFPTDVELAKVFWKLWGSKKEYLDLPEGWSTPEIDQRFDMVCKAMQAGFDPFDYDEEEGEDEEESFESNAETFASEEQVKKNSNLTELFFGGLIVSLLTLAAMKRE